MSQLFGNFIRGLLSGYGATRYLVTLLTVLLVLTYGLLTLGRIVPLYTDLAAALGMTPILMLVLLYLFMMVLCSLVWYLWILHPADSINTQLLWRGIYRQTDNTGVLWQGLLVLAGVVAGSYASTRLLNVDYYNDIAVYLAVVICLPLALDMVPAQRPRRIITSPDDRSALTVAYRLRTKRTPPEKVLSSLGIYNELEPDDPDLVEPDLPEGMLIEVPPRL